MSKYLINERIEEAYTLPGSFYTDPEVFESLKDKIFTRTWQYITTKDRVQKANSVFPFWYMPNYVEEPLLLTRDENDEIHCVSNVCTHRGNLLIESPGQCKHVMCRYHGRRFGLDGRFASMPGFEEATNFPTDEDHLASLPVASLKQMLFTSLDPLFDFSEISNVIESKVGFMNFDEMVEDESKHRIYLVKANWALYCDNYLEGFHIPFVHPGLNQSLDPKDYTTELYNYVNVQVGIAEDDVECFDLPEDHPDFGKNVAAYYFWVFPNLMLNFYPWGLSMNVVRPVSIDRTRVEYLTFVSDPSKIDSSAGAELDKVEREDEDVVENVQKAIGSRLYKRGRFSPTREQGVHHFHSLLSKFI